MTTPTINIGDWTNLTIQKVTNLYLYGQQATPAHVVDRLRSKQAYDDLPTIQTVVNGQNVNTPVLKIELDMNSFMSSGPGRYAKASEAKVVQDFFNGVFTLPQENVEYSKADLAQFGYLDNFPSNPFTFTVKHYEIDKDSSDYAARTYIFNQALFEISDDVKFIVENGVPKIKNMAVHAFDDNFDLSSSSGLTQLGNEYVLEPSVDPYGLGRRIEIEYTGKETIPTTTYSNVSFLNDLGFVQENKLLDPQFLLSEMLSVVSDLEDANTIDYINEHTEQSFFSTAFNPNSGYIVYGKPTDDTIKLSEYVVDTFAVGIGNGNDMIVTNDGNDTIYGSFGSDIVYAGEETNDADILTYENLSTGLTVNFVEQGEAGTNYTDRIEVANSEGMYVYKDFTDFGYGIETLKLTKHVDNVKFKESQSFAHDYSIDGGEDVDILDFSEMNSSVTVDMFIGEVGSVKFSSFEKVVGSDLVNDGDLFIGGENAVMYEGLAGVDLLDYGFLNLAAVDVDLKKGEISKLGTSNAVPQVDFVSSVEVFGGTDRGDQFKSLEGLSGAEFHAGSQRAFELDSLEFSEYQNGVTVNLAAFSVTDALGGDIVITGFEKVIGSGLVDNITGSSGQDWLYGGAGADTIEGGGESDFIFGEGGVDILNGGSGSDLYYYKNTSETDIITDDSGIADQIYMGGQFKFTGDDIVSRNMSGALIQGVAEFQDDAIESLTFVDGARFFMTNLGRTEPTAPTIQDVVIDGLTLTGDAGANTLTGGSDNDLFYGSLGADDMAGAAGVDTVNYQGSDAAVTVNLGAGSGAGGHAEGDSFSNIENVVGSIYGDTLNGSSGDDNRITGGGGNDVIDARNGNNIIYGGAGDDEIEAGTGDDFIDAGDGMNEIDAGDGNNVVLGGLDADTITTGTGVDVIEDDGGDNLINSGGGNDWITGSGTLNGEAGSDHITGIGTLNGGSGEDFLTSDSNGNTLNGGTENDYLNGNGYDNITYIVGNGTDVVNDSGVGGVILMENGSEATTIFEKAENGSLVITAGSHKVIVVDHFNGSPIEGVKFEVGGTVYAIPEDGIKLTSDEFSGEAIDTLGDDIFETQSGVDSSISTTGGNDSIRITADSGLTNIKPIDLTTVGGLTVIIEGVSINDVSAVRHMESPNSISLYNGTTGRVVLDGDISQIGPNALLQIGGINYTLDDIGVITLGSTGSDNSDPFSLTGEIEGDVTGLSVDDTIFGGFGDDKLIGGDGIDSLFGESGNDELLGGAGDDILNGGEGADVVDGGAGANTLIDSAGDDVYFVGGDDLLEVGSGINEVRAQDSITDLSTFIMDFSFYGSVDASNNLNGAGFFRDFSGSNAVDYKLSYGGGQIILDHYVDLTDAPSLILSDGSTAQLGSFVIEGFGSEDDDSYNELAFFTEDDLIYAGGGNDAFTLVDGNDIVYGGDGNDTLVKSVLSQNTPHGSGNLEAYGEAGNDTLRGGLGNDILDGGEGNDSITDISGGTDQMFGGDGDDTFTIGWGNGDLVDGGEGNDTVLLFSANTFAPSSYSYEIDLEEQTITSAAGTHQLVSIENAAGSENNDTLTGNDENNFLYGWAGDDHLFGQAGNDTYLFQGETSGLGLPLGSGDDTISDSSGAADAIWLQQTTNINTIVINETGFGNDMELVIGTGGDTITIENQLAIGSAEQIENLILADGTIYDLTNYLAWYDSSTAGQGATETGTATTDVFVGTNGLNDTVDYSASTTLIDVNLNIGIGLGGYADGDIYNNIESIIGSAFNDIITGNGDVNNLFGGLGNDILSGGVGDDLLFGGDGDDAYIFNIGDGINTILESSGFDTLNLGVGITFGDLTFNRSGDDLDIQIASGFLIKDFYSGDTDKLVEQIEFDDGSTFDLTSLLETTPDGPPIIDFAGASFASYNGSQDAGGTISVIQSATGVELEGNAWKKIALDYDITANTVISFDFKSTIEGEIQGFGLESDDNYSVGASNFQLYGTDSPSYFNDDFTYTGAGDWQHFSIDVGSYQTGDIDWLAFVNDHDNGTEDGTSSYRNISLYERDPLTTNVAPVAIDDEFIGAQDTDIVGNLIADNFNGTDRDADGDALTVVAGTFSATNGSVTILANGDYTYTPNTGFTGTDSFTYTLQDDEGVQNNATATFYVDDPSIDETFIGTSAVEFFDGGAGIDTVDYSGSATRVKMTLSSGGWDGDADGDNYLSIENVIGSDIASDKDFIYGNDTDNTIWGLAGNDELEGKGGADILDGGAGGDYANYLSSDSAVTVNLLTNINTGGHAEGDTFISIEKAQGSDYDDHLTGNNGSNILIGQRGDDTLSGGLGNDILDGHWGDDTFIYTAGHDTIKDRGSGDETLIFDAAWSPEDVVVSGHQLVLQDSTVNRISFQDINLIENFVFDGFSSMDLATLMTFNAPIQHVGTAGDDVFIATSAVEEFDGGEQFQGGGGTDTVDYSNSASRVKLSLLSGTGWEGDAVGDTYISIENIIGSNTTGSADYIYGNAEDNYISGLGGNDQLEGDAGADTIDGGAGGDYSNYMRSDAAVNINLETNVHTGGHAEGDDLISIEKIQGSNYDDVIIGSSIGNTLQGHSGDDEIRGGDGGDILYGHNGDDILYGDGGSDDIFGNSGADSFMFEATTAFDGVDSVKDFSVAEGDVLDISDILLGYDPLTDAIGDFVSFTDDGTHSTLLVDADGGADNYVALTYISNVTGLDEDVLETSGNLIAA